MISAISPESKRHTRNHRHAVTASDQASPDNAPATHRLTPARRLRAAVRTRGNVRNGKSRRARKQLSPNGPPRGCCRVIRPGKNTPAGVFSSVPKVFI